MTPSPEQIREAITVLGIDPDDLGWFRDGDIDARARVLLALRETGRILDAAEPDPVPPPVEAMAEAAGYLSAAVGELSFVLASAQSRLDERDKVGLRHVWDCIVHAQHHVGHRPPKYPPDSGDDQ